MGTKELGLTEANRVLSKLLVAPLNIQAVFACLFYIRRWGLAKSPTQSESLDKEVLERLPYWVRELLKMLEEVKKPSAKGSDKERLCKEPR